MGSLMDKLDYLVETTEQLKDLVDATNPPSSADTETLRENISRLVECFTSFADLYSSTRLDLVNMTSITLANGEVVKKVYPGFSTKYIIFPKVHYTGTFDFPLVISGENIGSTMPSYINHLDLSGYTGLTTSCYFRFQIKESGIKSLILPKYFSLGYWCYQISYQSQRDVAFTNGLMLGKRSVNSNDTWITNYIGDESSERYVDCMDDFEGTIYLSRISMTVESMVRMFNKLKDLTGTGEEYTFNVGTDNLAKLTEVQKHIAENKGWRLT